MYNGRRFIMAADDFTVSDEADAIVAEMLEEHQTRDAGGKMTSAPFDWSGVAESIEGSLAANPPSGNFEPPEPELWRTVAAELRRRGQTI